MGLVFVDVRMAFDTVNHQFLCLKLMNYGVKRHTFLVHILPFWA